MLIERLLRQPDDSGYSLLSKQCSRFLNESEHLPLFKSLPSSYDDLQKVKVRYHKSNTAFSETFNEAFKQEQPKLRQRAVFVSGVVHISEDTNTEPFYVFPTNNFKFMYSREVKNSNDSYQQAFDAILEQFNNKEQADQIIADLLQYTYVSDNLNEGIKSEAEIILYNIPYYYAVRANTIDYDELLTSLI